MSDRIKEIEGWVVAVGSWGMTRIRDTAADDEHIEIHIESLADVVALIGSIEPKIWGLLEKARAEEGAA